MSVVAFAVFVWMSDWCVMVCVGVCDCGVCADVLCLAWCVCCTWCVLVLCCVRVGLACFVVCVVLFVGFSCF